VNRYDAFVREHYETLTHVIGRPDYDGSWMGERYIPLWNDPEDMERLSWLCQKYGKAAISDKAVNGKTISKIRNAMTRWDAKLIAVSSKPDILETLSWDSAVVGSWTSAVRYGETQVWDGHGLRRYPAQQKESSRKKHRADIMRLGIDMDAIVQDDNNEVAKLAIKSWKAWESQTFGVYDPVKDDDEQELGLSQIDPDSNNIRGVEKRHENEKVVLPIMGVEQYASPLAETLAEQGEDGEISMETVSTIRYNSNLLRQCNNCYLSSRCPAFRENAECGFKLPIEIKTKDQLQSALRAMLEMQVSRVLFARFAEELEGQGLDPALSDEIDRLFSFVEKFKDISDTRDMVRLEVEARGSSGVLSRLFGANVGDSTKRLTGGGFNAQQSDAMYSEILDLSEDN
jgi:hypothetical protein